MGDSHVSHSSMARSGSTSNHRQLQSLLPRARNRILVPRVGVAHHARRWIVPQHSRDAGVGFFRAIAHDHEAGVLRVTHADAAAVVERYPGGATGGVEQCVEQRPVGNRIGTVTHGFGFAVG